MTIIINEALLTLFNNTDYKFSLKFEEDNDAFASKTQLYSFFYNVSYFKYRVFFLRQC